MPRPTETALKGRARALLEAMSERARWIYALPRDEPGESSLEAALTREGLVCEERDADASVSRYALGKATFVVFDSPELDVTLVEASGDDAPPILAKLLDERGFYAQSRLIGTALDVKDPEAGKALRTLAHMVVAWDEDWTDLFLLHLASPDPVARHDAVAALSIAAMVARDPRPAIDLLREARSREKFPKLAETMGEAIDVLTAAVGGPVQAREDG
jgi:hypothetical protein